MFDNAYRGRRVLVTGHTGFKGSWLAHWLSRLGAEVAGYSLYIPSQPANFEVLGLEQRIAHHVGDVCEYGALAAVFAGFRPEVVFHLAAQAIVRTSYDEPKRTFDTNLGGTVNLLEALRATTSVRAAVIITSDKCYENVEWDWGYRETDRLGGKDPYSASKACAEIAISAYTRSFLAPAGKFIASTRAGNVIGGGDWAADRIVPDCMRAWAEGKPAELRSPHSTRPWQHVLEPIGGYLWLGSRLLAGDARAAGEAFNFGPQAQVNHPVSQLVAEMANHWPGTAAKIVASETQQKAEAGLLKLDCDKALARLAWRPALAFEEGVRLTAEWYTRYYSGRNDMKALTDTQIDFYAKRAADQGIAWAAA
jgi:CDP-glucose 4,6-dehydratase